MPHLKGFIPIIVVAFIAVIAAGMVGAAWWYSEKSEEIDQVEQALISNFEECAAAGNPVMESYPRQCRANDKTFVEDISDDLIASTSTNKITYKQGADPVLAEADCSDRGGTFNECGSLCDDGEICPTVCVPICLLASALSNTNTATSSDEISDWKIYTNEEYGYAVKHPRDWDITTTLASSGFVGLYAPDDSVHITISPDFGFNTFGFDALEQTTMQTTLGGKTVTRVVWNDSDGAIKNCSYQFEESPHEKWVPAIVTDEIDTTAQSPAGNFIDYSCEDKEVVPKILSTFEFIN